MQSIDPYLAIERRRFRTRIVAVLAAIILNALFTPPTIGWLVTVVLLLVGLMVLHYYNAESMWARAWWRMVSEQRGPS